MTVIYYLSHPEVAIDPATPVPDWGLSAPGRARVLAVRDAPWLRACRRIVTSAELAGAPGFQLRIHEGGGAADLGGGEALEAELGHDLLDISRRHALDVHLGDGKH